MLIVIGAVVAAILLFILFRALASPRPRLMGPMDPYAQPMAGPMYIDEPNPIADIATVVATEVIVDTALGAFDSGPADMGGGFDPGPSSGFGDGSF